MPTGFHLHHGHEAKRQTSTVASEDSYGRNSVTSRATNAPSASSSPPRTAGISQQQLQRFDVLLRRPENRECFDCGAKQPRWASTNLGIFFCLRCAGVHRSMGTHISQVKSTNMDAWEERMIRVMEHISNIRGRLLYEYNMPQGARVTSSSETSIVERALRAKYEKKTYYNPQFAELFAQFMETPMEGVTPEAAAPAATARGGFPAPPGSNAPPRRVQPSQQRQPALSPSPAMDELWGPPVSSPNDARPTAPITGGSGHNHTFVAELFTSPYPGTSGTDHSPSPPPGTRPLAWSNATSGPNGTPQGGAATSTFTSSPPVVSRTASSGVGWFDNNFVAPTGNPLSGSGAPSPASPQSPFNPPSARSNTDDLFQMSGSTPNTGRSTGSKDEILSLFASAPVAGAGGQTGGGAPYTSPTNGQNMAWQPQTVKPFYH